MGTWFHYYKYNVFNEFVTWIWDTLWYFKQISFECMNYAWSTVITARIDQYAFLQNWTSIIAFSYLFITCNDWECRFCHQQFISILIVTIIISSYWLVEYMNIYFFQVLTFKNIFSLEKFQNFSITKFLASNSLVCQCGTKPLCCNI